MTSLRARYVGTLLGLAAGDALGGSVEFMPRGAIQRAYPGGLREITGGGSHDLRLGEVTDDTAMALAIARACTPDGIDLDQVAENFLTWYRSDPKDIGITTSRALAKMDAGVPWPEIGERMMAETPRKLAGNGSVMRCAPVALRFRHDREQLREVSLDTARMTHPDPMATWGGVALNQAIAYLLDGGDRDGVRDAATADIENAEVAEAIRMAADREYDDVRSGGFVLETLGAAFWALARSDSAEEAIVTAVNMGDDTDTTGAVTGALVGAHYGVDALPDRWLVVLEPREELIVLAERLLEWSEADAARS
ncbi:MAG TPA: ADP-ribosylglycohydrolase family protein [Thermomicrobiales bacterium]|nr:ADP-ribosylglycohydrolase family protein [Thermomicrobiales bacterium]